MILNELSKSENQTPFHEAILSIIKKQEFQNNYAMTEIGKIEKEVYDACINQSRVYNAKYVEYLNEMKCIGATINENQKKLEKLKTTYFESSRLAHEQEKMSIKKAEKVDLSIKPPGEVTGKVKKSNKEKALINSLDVLSKCRIAAENNSQAYRSELLKRNRFAIEAEVRYSKLKERIQELEESRAIHLTDYFSTFFRLSQGIYGSFADNMMQSVNSISLIDFNDNSKLMIKMHKQFKKVYPGYNKFVGETNIRRLPLEEVYNYEILKRSDWTFINLGELEHFSVSDSSKKRKFEELEVMFRFHVPIKAEAMQLFFDKLSQETKEKKLQNRPKIIDHVMMGLNSLEDYSVSHFTNFHNLSVLIVALLNNESSTFKIFELLKYTTLIYHNMSKRSFQLAVDNEVEAGIKQKANLNNTDILIKSNSAVANLASMKLENDSAFGKELIDSVSYYNIRLSLISTLKLMNSYKTSSFWINVLNDEITYRMNLTLKDLIDNDKVTASLIEGFSNNSNNKYIKNVIKENTNIQELIKALKHLETLKRNLIFTILKEFMEMVSLTNIDMAEASNVILHFSNSEVLEKDKCDYLISYFYSQSYSLKILKNKEFIQDSFSLKSLNISKNVTGKQLKQSVIANSWIFHKQDDLAGLLLINKYICNNLRNERYLCYFNNSALTGKLDNAKRKEIWKKILLGKCSKDKYSFRKQYVPPKPKLRRFFSEINFSAEDLCTSQKSKNYEYDTGVTESSTKDQECLDNYNRVIDTNDDLYSRSPIIQRSGDSMLSSQDLSIRLETSNLSDNAPNFQSLSYSEIIKVVEGDPQIVSLFNTIKLDVNRTFHKHSKSAELRQKLTNILRVLAYITKVGYCQGMNYVGSFLLYMIDDEEEAFSIFYLLIQATDYSILFENKLHNLKKYFYIFDRLTEILLPELSLALKRNSIDVSFFSSSWFITLFTSLLTSETVISNILYFIWDEFILKGWPAILKACICLLKINQDKLFLMKYEEMLHFMLNDINRCWFFDNDYFMKSYKLFVSINLDADLFSNLEHEYDLKNKWQDEN